MRGRAKLGRRLAWAIALAAAGALLHGGHGWGAPLAPADPDTVLEHLPRAAGATAAELRRLAAGGGNPQDPAAAIIAAERFLALGQTVQDPRFVGYARAALAPWWADDAAPPAILLLRAAIRQNRHEFGSALADLDLVLRANPRDARALELRAAILLVLGRPRMALDSCAAARRRAASITATTCEVAATARLGRAEAAFVLLDLTLARSSGLDPDVERWARTELAEVARLAGRPETAVAQLRAVLALQPADAFAATALADLLLDADRARDALDVVADDPAHDGKLLRAALAARRLGDPAWSEEAARLAERFVAARLRGDALHLREEARFRLELRDEPAAALALAQANWRTQREPADARILLDAAAAAGRPAAAGPVLAWLEETGLRDPQLEAVRRHLREGGG